MTIKNIKSGFRVTRVYPLNEAVFVLPEEKLFVLTLVFHVFLFTVRRLRENLPIVLQLVVRISRVLSPHT